MTKSILFALLPIFAIACTSASEDASEDTARANEAAMIETIGSRGVPAGGEDFHLPSFNDVTNLHLDADGTFVWNIQGCDYYGAECGTWRTEPDGTITLSKGGASFRWMNDEWFGGTTKELWVTRFADGSIAVNGIVDDKPLAQIWRKGVDCMRCFEGSAPICEAATPDLCEGR